MTDTHTISTESNEEAGAANLDEAHVSLVAAKTYLYAASEQLDDPRLMALADVLQGVVGVVFHTRFGDDDD